MLGTHSRSLRVCRDDNADFSFDNINNWWLIVVSLQDTIWIYLITWGEAPSDIVITFQVIVNRIAWKAIFPVFNIAAPKFQYFQI